MLSFAFPVNYKRRVERCLLQITLKFKAVIFFFMRTPAEEYNLKGDNTFVSQDFCGFQKSKEQPFGICPRCEASASIIPYKQKV